MAYPKHGPITQIGYVVEDLDTSIRRWIDTTGVGPWTVFRNVTLNGAYRGEATTVTMHVGLSYQNGLQIELIQQTNAAASPYLDERGAPLVGAHHIAWLTDDLDAEIAAAQGDGLALAFRAENPGTRVAYLEMGAGMRLEFIESQATAELIKEGAAAARVWDGSNPVRVIDFATL